MARHSLRNHMKAADGTETNVDLRSIHKFAASLRGELVVPGNRPYHQARRVWNRAVNVHPAIIARCANTQDVVRAVEFARRYGLLTAIRSGGHSFAGHGVCKRG